MDRSIAFSAHLALGATLVAAGALAVSACGSSSNASSSGWGVVTEDASPPSSGGDGDGSSPFLIGEQDGGGFGDASGGAVLSNVTIAPSNATLPVQAGKTATLAYKVMAVQNGSGAPVDVTDRFVFWVPDNYLIGDFPAAGGPTFTTRASTAAASQQGGTLTVEADGLNPGGVPIKATTSLTVQLSASINATDLGGAGPIPSNPGSLFGGPTDATRAPVLEYPNNGVMLPPNLRVLDVHWMPGSSANTLYQVTFKSAAATIVYYTRCGTVGGLIAPGGCGFELDSTGYGYLAQSNAGRGNVALTIAGTDDTGTSVGTSATFDIQFAQQPVNGGVYYWDVTDTQIMRFDFGGVSNAPDVFFKPGQYGTKGTCVGCHILSPDGTKIAASEGGQGDGFLDYSNDVASISAPLTVTESSTSRVQFGSFDPFGSQFVAVDGDGQMTSGGNSMNNLWFHDGNTGLVVPSETKTLSFEPDHPAWSPDGTMIAMTHVGAHNTSQREYLGGIDVATFAAGSVTDGGVNVGANGTSLGDPVVVVPSNVITGANAVNSYNPSFAPDSTFLVFSQTLCAVSDSTSQNCDSDIADNVSATTWAVKPTAGATPIHLDQAAAPGVIDGASAVIMDTFPRATPFETTQGTGKLFWFTVASLRQPGLRQKNYDPSEQQQQLWMFAVDPAKILAGEDGSFTAFFLPFQDPKTSNHIAEWTQQIVSATPAPPVPTPPPPAPPPAPPPPK
jgi:hypothetical protein